MALTAHPSWCFSTGRPRLPRPCFRRRGERGETNEHGETKIKCKWKFIAPGDRRRFRTFKYFINFLLASAATPGSRAPPPLPRVRHRRRRRRRRRRPRRRRPRRRRPRRTTTTATTTTITTTITTATTHRREAGKKALASSLRPSPRLYRVPPPSTRIEIVMLLKLLNGCGSLLESALRLGTPGVLFPDPRRLRSRGSRRRLQLDGPRNSGAPSAAFPRRLAAGEVSWIFNIASR
jgi:hypothetical protein